MTTPIERNGTGINWPALQRRVAQGCATVTDAEPVQAIGLLPQALRIQSGLATADDALIIALKVNLINRSGGDA